MKSPVYLYPIISSMIMLSIFWGFGPRGVVDLIRGLDFSNKDLYLIFLVGGFVFRYFVSANEVAINSTLASLLASFQGILMDSK